MKKIIAINAGPRKGWNTDQLIQSAAKGAEDSGCEVEYEDIKKKFGDDDKKRISELGVVSADESAVWLIDYWCSKDIFGLIKMLLSRHWIMHIEAANRIKEKILDR